MMLVSLTAAVLTTVAQQAQEVPAELAQLLGLALGTVAVTGFLKKLAAGADKKIKGYGAVFVSFLVAALLVALSIGMGWYTLEMPAFDGDPYTYLQAWLTTAGGVTFLANVVYVLVYEKIASPRAPSAPTT